jgi:hypothetical protein
MTENHQLRDSKEICLLDILYSLILVRRGTSHQSPDGNRYGESSSQGKSHNSPTRFSARCSRDLNSQKDAATRAKGCISLLDSDSDGEAEKKIMIPGGAAAPGAISLSDDDVICTSQRNIIQEDEDDEFQLSDEDFPELLQQAREQERAKDQQRLQAREAKEKDLDRKAMSDGFDDVFDTPKVNDDPIVEILITSKMEGTKPVMVKRKLSQRLKEAKFGWCDKQTDHGQTQEEFRGSVFLTWKKHKLHDMTTCRSLGVKVGEDGKPSYDAAGMDADGRIHLVAWTSKAYEIFLEREAEKEKREHARANGEEAQMNSGTKMKLILRPKNQEDFKLLVKPTTLISKLITAFSTARGIDEETTVSLYFDGDKLDPETSIAETELSDRDTVEVHIR